MTTDNLFEKLRDQVKGEVPSSVLSYDPGETTGIAHFEYGELESYWESKSILNIGEHYLKMRPNITVIEKFQLYDWKAKSKSWSTFPTIEVIGVLKFLAALNGSRVVLQSASTGKGFWSDAKLKASGLYVKGSPHIRDAIRHGAHYLTFGRQKENKYGH